MMCKVCVCDECRKIGAWHGGMLVGWISITTCCEGGRVQIEKQCEKTKPTAARDKWHFCSIDCFVKFIKGMRV